MSLSFFLHFKKGEKMYLFKISSAFLVILFFGLTTNLVEATGPAVMVTNYQVSPDVLVPKDIGTITVTIKNSAKYATADIQKVYIFAPKLDVVKRSYDNVGQLGPEESMNLTFVFKAPDTDGIYFPEVRINVFNSVDVRYPIPVKVNMDVSSIKEPAIEVKKTIPDYIIPGDDFNIILSLINRGQSRANKINVKINLSSPLFSKSPNNYYITRLKPDKKHEINLTITSDERSELGLYSIPILIEYSGSGGFFKKQEETLGVQMKGEAKLDIAQKKIDKDAISVGETFTLTLKIENIGSCEAKGVKAYLESDRLYGDKTAYLGKISKNDYANAIFTLTSEKSGSIEPELRILYEDDQGVDEFLEDITLIVYPASKNYFSIVVLLLSPLVIFALLRLIKR